VKGELMEAKRRNGGGKGGEREKGEREKGPGKYP
jgi:hypothetical protein